MWDWLVAAAPHKRHEQVDGRSEQQDGGENVRHCDVQSAPRGGGLGGEDLLAHHEQDDRHDNRHG